VFKALKNMVNVNIERDADGNITGAAVETDNKGERAILTQAMTQKWFDRLVATVCAIAKRDDREMVRLGQRPATRRRPLTARAGSG
tara:strand:- start:3108 stop:3365 length:258 start_codon:yes stop_codon:yes gene_type:complete